MRITETLLAAVLLAASGTAHAWWNPDWKYRKALTLDTTATGANLQTPLADVPVLVRLHTGNFRYFLDTQDGGADLCFFAADDATPLDFHVERWDAINEMALVWVRVPALAAQSKEQTIWMYYGNPAAPPAGKPGATYDSAQALAYHFTDSGPPVDASAWGHQPVSAASIANPAALIGAGGRLSGAGGIVIPDAPPLRFSAATGYTLSTWLRLDAAPGAEAVLFERSDGPQSLAVVLDGTSIRARHTGGDGATAETPPAPLPAVGQWHHVALTGGAGTLTLYVDGAPAGSVPAALADLGGVIAVGAASDGTRALTGDLDEIQIASTARSAEWLALQAHSQGESAALLGYGADQDQASAGDGEVEHVGHFTIIFRTVFGSKDAIVEQIVIGFCGLMFAVAAMIMVMKASYLHAASGATRRFLRAFEGLGLDSAGTGGGLDSLYGEKRYRKSPLYHVYCQGIEEVRKRRSPAVGAQAAGLDAKALNTVRAAMDAVMVREGQKLNAMMVLLTIAISGGPFIGLLGTVVGVMVTFAAIAATGDVNITAIAPGMAAALLATVAGLGVAIPSLFGYNYLGSRVKEISADMHVFADELLARINETYGL